MREIKFRLRDKDNNIVGYEKWQETSLPNEEFGAWIYSKDNKYWSSAYIPHHFKDQYTGLKDSQGKEIYEGDIVRYKQKPPHKQVAIDYFSQVIYKENMFCLKPSWIRWNESAFGFMAVHVEVIGTIYSNKELLDE